MDRSVDVAVFLPDLAGGGGQRVTCNVASCLADRGYDVELVLAQQQGPLVDHIGNEVSIHTLGARRLPGVGIGPSVFSLWRYLGRTQPDVLVSALRYANAIAATAGMLADVPVIPTEHTTFDRRGDGKSQLTARLAETLFPRMPQVVAVSAGIKRTLVRHTPLEDDDVTVIYNPAVTQDLPAMAAEPIDQEWFETHDVVLGVGRLEPEKNFSGLLRSFARLHDARPETRLVILGQGAEYETLEAVASDLGVSDVVSFPGFVENPYKYMEAASVVALSSIREGLPTVLIEALACGTPVVSTACPHGPREILNDGEYGLLTPVDDDQAFAKALFFSLRSPADPERLQARASAFTPETITQEYVSLIESYSR